MGFNSGFKGVIIRIMVRTVILATEIKRYKYLAITDGVIKMKAQCGDHIRLLSL